MHKARSRQDFEVKAGVHQGSILSPLPFIIVLEALSGKLRSGVPLEDLYMQMILSSLLLAGGMNSEALAM